MPEVENDNVEVSKLMKNLGLEDIDVNIIGRLGAKVEGKIRNLKVIEIFMFTQILLDFNN